MIGRYWLLVELQLGNQVELENICAGQEGYGAS